MEFRKSEGQEKANLHFWSGTGLVLAVWQLSPIARCPPQTIHDCNSQTGFADGLGDDRIEARFIEQPHHEKQPDRSFGELAAAGAE